MRSSVDSASASSKEAGLARCAERAGFDTMGKEISARMSVRSDERVVVVGGGVSGSACAIGLAVAGRRVLVVSSSLDTLGMPGYGQHPLGPPNRSLRLKGPAERLHDSTRRARSFT